MPDKFDKLSKKEQKRLAKKYGWQQEDVIVRPPTKKETQTTSTGQGNPNP